MRLTKMNARLERAAETARRTDAMPRPPLPPNSPIGYTIREPARSFGTLSEEEAATYIECIAAGANADAEAMQTANAILPGQAHGHIAEIQRINRKSDVVEYEIARLGASAPVRASLIPRTNSNRYKFTRAVSVEGVPFEVGEEISGEQCPAGTLKSLLRVKHIEQL